MIAMGGANSFEMMGKLLGLFSGRYLRGSQNMCMAKQLKPLDGHIAQINAPRFAEDRNMWVMMVKENGKWPSVTLPRTLADIGSGKHDFQFLMLGKVRHISGDKVVCLPAFG